MHKRRVFLVQTCLGGAVLLARPAFAQDAMVAESDPQAQALGYHADGSQTDRARFPNYASGDKCSACTKYETLVGKNYGGCPLFPGKQVAANGWCSAFEVAM